MLRAPSRSGGYVETRAEASAASKARITARRGRFVPILLISSLIGASVVAGIQSSQTPPGGVDCSLAEVETSDEAGSIAAACDVEVEVLSERTPWVTVFARPDGQTRMTVDAVPEHTNVNGVWEPIDVSVIPAAVPANVAEDATSVSGHGGGVGAPATTRTDVFPIVEERTVGDTVVDDEVTDDGEDPEDEGGGAIDIDTESMLGVAAPVFPLWFNPGGDAGEGLPLGVVERDDAWVKLWFPLPLPEPTLDDRFVTYELAAGARLIVAVMVDGSGFRPVVELDTPEAADWLEDELSLAREERGLPGSGLQMPFEVEASDGVSMQGVEDTGFEFVNESGEILFSSPPSLMWDSSADAAEDSGEVRAEFPLPGDRSLVMPVDVVAGDEGEGTVLVSPNEEMLSDADTVWPVRIDPTLGGRTPTAWVAVRTGGYTSAIYKWADTSSRVGESMGHCSLSWTSACVTTFTSRLVWEFRDSGSNSVGSWLDKLSGSDITSATFSADPGQRGNCTSTRTDAYQTDGISSSQQSWSSMGFLKYASNITAPQGDACSDSGVRREWDVKSVVVDGSNQNWPSVTIGLKANNESSSSGYKTYKNDARLDIVFNRAPNVPTSVKMTSPAQSCVSGSSRPVLATTTPTFSAVASDPDGGNVRVRFQVYIPSPESEAWNSGDLAAKASGSTFSAKVASGKLVAGKVYRYRAYTTDGARRSSWSSAFCEFTVDVTKPASPTVTPVRTGVAAIYDSDVERGGVGVAGKFTISRGNSSDVTQFKYSFNNTSLTSTATPNTSGTAQIAFTPTTAGPVTLRVSSRDKAGNESPPTTYVFDVAAAKEDAIWMLDEGEGDVAADASGTTPARDLEVSGAGWLAGPHDLFGSRPGDGSLSFDGTDDVASTGPVVDTSESFVVSAFVWLNAEATSADDFTAVSQDGIVTSAFQLGYSQSCPDTTAGCWSFRMRDADAGTAPLTFVKSTVPGVRDEWVHLVAEHDAATKTMSIWVCEIGTPESPATGNPVQTTVPRAAAPWDSTGAFVLGRGYSNSAVSSWWPGKIDNVRVFKGEVVAESKIRRMCQGAEATDFDSDLDALDPTIIEGE